MHISLDIFRQVVSAVPCRNSRLWAENLAKAAKSTGEPWDVLKMVIEEAVQPNTSPEFVRNVKHRMRICESNPVPLLQKLNRANPDRFDVLWDDVCYKMARSVDSSEDIRVLFSLFVVGNIIKMMEKSPFSTHVVVSTRYLEHIITENYAYMMEVLEDEQEKLPCEKLELFSRLANTEIVPGKSQSSLFIRSMCCVHDDLFVPFGSRRRKIRRHRYRDRKSDGIIVVE